MSLELIFSILILALIDSINPSALVITGFLLLKSPRDKRLLNMLTYIAGIYVSYLIIGVLILLGVNEFVNALKDIASSVIYLYAQLAIGVSLLVFAIAAPVETKPSVRQRRELRISKIMQPKLLFVYGAYVTTAELITALPYFAAIALLVNAQLSLTLNLAVLVMYCLIFVMPPLVLTALYRYKKDWFDTVIENRSDRQKRVEREVVLWVIGIIGFFLTAQSLNKLYF